jgi:hypothetical protein
MRELGTVLSGGSIYPIAKNPKLACAARDGDKPCVPLQMSALGYSHEEGSLFGDDYQHADYYLITISAEHTSVVIDATSPRDQSTRVAQCRIEVRPGDEITLKIQFDGWLYTHLPHGLKKEDEPSAVIRYNGRVDGKQQFSVVSNDRVAFYVYASDSDFV